MLQLIVKSVLGLAFMGMLASTSVKSAPAETAADPGYQLIEAESVPAGQVVASDSASGGKYVQRDGDYQPVAVVNLPAVGDAFTVWVRQRGMQLQLKGVDAAGGQHELNWNWDKPSRWKWVSFGAHTRAELGAKALFMRGPGGAANAGIDAILFATKDGFDPSRDLPALPLLPIAVTLDWGKTIARAGAMSYGLNGYGAFDPAIAQNAQYEANMALMRPGLIRYHNYGMMDDSKKSGSGWIDYDQKRWDAARVGAAMRGAFAYGPAKMINIPGWPSWMADKEGFLAPDKKAEFAAFCADLVRIANVQLKQKVTYWEVTNERDDRYFGDFHQNGGALKDPNKPDRVEELAAIYVACAKAMKAMDPTIKVGGPGAARPDYFDFCRRFTIATRDNLDFYSIHTYASGSASDPDDQIYDVASASWATAGLVKILKELSPNRHIEAFVDEFNISWSWETRDPRMADHRGAIYDALVVTQAVQAGADGTAAWNDHDGIYGKMDGANNLRLPGRAYALYNRYLIGTVVSATSSAPEDVTAFAVSNGSARSLMLINRSSSARIYRLDAAALAGRSLTLHSIDRDGYRETVAPKPEVILPALSLSLFTWQTH